MEKKERDEIPVERRAATTASAERIKTNDRLQEISDSMSCIADTLQIFTWAYTAELRKKNK